MLAGVVLTLVTILAAVLWIIVVWAVSTSSTDSAILEAGAIRRAWRWYRCLWLRVGASVMSWPHVLDRGARAVRPPRPFEVVWRGGPGELRRYPGGNPGREPVLLVHSLISTPEVLDLTAHHSLVGALLAAGNEVFLLDWPAVARTDPRLHLRDYCQLTREAENVVRSITGASRLHIVGYCLGGTIAALRLAAWPTGDVASFAAIATPIDFAAPSTMQATTSSRLFKPVLVLDQWGRVPAALIRESFHLLRPRALRAVMAARKARREPEHAETAAAIARWAWQHRPLGGGVFLELVELSRSDRQFDGSVVTAGWTFDLTQIAVPVLVSIAARDHIVPGGAAMALATVPGLEVETVVSAGGHVSMISGADAPRALWPRLTRWLDQHQPPQATAAPQAVAAGTRGKRPRAATSKLSPRPRSARR
ncbi:MAG: poly[(R)-3-hydroxyalkanoate] polymerase subunit PhaC [Chloroflexota bacterium]|nr:poly[(R)-3-hydroxyalkanoate] polymerase subunit PhaC [Chloroflexota bacterium]